MNTLGCGCSERLQDYLSIMFAVGCKNVLMPSEELRRIVRNEGAFWHVVFGADYVLLLSLHEKGTGTTYQRHVWISCWTMCKGWAVTRRSNGVQRASELLVSRIASWQDYKILNGPV
jgi:hypothetical protein